jgi:multidrug efflux pump
LNLSEVFIRRPVATTLLTFGLVLIGILGYTALPVSALPQVDTPTLVVSTFFPGASAETVAATVTTPLERQLGQMPALAGMTSTSSFGASLITVRFDLERDIDAAEQDVQAALNAASNLLPNALPAPPVYSKSNPADTPIVTLAVQSDSLPLSAVADIADSVLAQKIAQVSGVGQVLLGGGQKPAVRVQVDPQALAATGLSLEDIRAALQVGNVNAPKGNLDGLRQAYTLSTNDQLFAAKDFAQLVVAYRQGAPLRLQDVATVVDDVENKQLAAWSNKKRAVLLSVKRQPGANVIAVVDRIKALLPSLRQSLPPGCSLEIMSDRTQTVRASVDDVQRTLLLTVALVIGVIYSFLHSLRATFIPGLAVPLSLLGTFGAMDLMGYSLNNLSLMALTISTGFVVDDAIVMLENITRMMESGLPPFQAALKGARQIGFTIVSLTVSLVAVLIPLLFMQGLIGRLFREFAVTLSLAIGISALVSLTVTPALCAYVLRDFPATHAASQSFFEKIFQTWQRLYAQGLRTVLQHQTLTLWGTAATLGLTLALAWMIPKGFFPEQDTGLLLGTTQIAADASFAAMGEKQREVVDKILTDADVAGVTSSIGVDGQNTTANSGRLQIELKPRGERRSSAQKIGQRLVSQAATLPGISLYVQAAQDLQLDSRISRTQYQITLQDASAAQLQQFAPKVLQALGQLPQLRDVASDQQAGGLTAKLSLDRDTAARLGVSPKAIDDVLYDAFGQRMVSIIFTQLNQYRVILEVKPEFAQNQRALEKIYVPGRQGNLVPLSVFTTLTSEPAPLLITHQGQFPAVTVSFNQAPHVALGEAVQAIEMALKNLDLPPSLQSNFEGTAQAFIDSLKNMPSLIFAALLTVYIVLGVLYESFIHPITILSTLPSAGVGALAALWLSGEEFGIIALIGIILLIGIVKKNAIMMIDFALEAQRQQGLAAPEAIYQTCLLRFRPIMMTTLAALFGALPLALGSGTGAELRRPLGISIVGGLLLSQLLTLFTTPVIYLLMDRVSKKLQRGTADDAPLLEV